MSFKKKYIIIFAIVFGVSLAFMMLVFSIYQDKKSEEKFIALYSNTVENKSAFIKQKVNNNFTAINNLSLYFSAIADPITPVSMQRRDANSILKNLLTNNEYMTAIFAVFEPNVFDGKDSLFANTPFHDSSGRFIPLWYKTPDEKIYHDYVRDYSKAQSLYFMAKDRLEPVMSSPIITRKKATNIVEVTYAEPIIYANKFLGTVGAKISVNWIQEYIDKLAKDMDAQVAVVMNNGKILNVSDNPLISGKDLHFLFPDNTDFYFLKFKKNLYFQHKDEDYYIFSYPIIFNNSNNFWHIIFKVKKQKISAFKDPSFYFVILFSLLIVVIDFFFIYFLINNFNRKLLNFTTPLERMATGELVEVNSENAVDIKEFETISQIMTRIRKRMIGFSNVAKSIANDNFDIEFVKHSEYDEMGKNINLMIKKLRDIKTISEERERQAKQLDWRRQGIAYINDSIRISSSDIQELSDNVIMSLAEYSKAILAGLFIYNDEDKKNPYLYAITTFAYEKKKAFSKTIKLNEGLVGTCALERKPIYLTKVPDDYIHVTSGLGSAKPKSIYILPLIFEEQLVGVLEIAFMRELKDFERKFLDHAANTLASALTTAKINAKTTELLEQSQKQEEILREKETELRKNLEQLRKTQHEMEIREAEMRGILNAVNNTIMTIEYTTEGILLNANEKYLKTMHYTLDELKGVNVLDLVKTERDELKRVIEMVSKGQFYQKVMKRFTKFGEVRWLLSTYTPFYDVNGKITKILYFAYDITESKEQAERLEKQIQILKKELERTNKKLDDCMNDKNENETKQ